MAKADAMLWISTRGGQRVTFVDAFLQGLAKDGGLFVPDFEPNVTVEEFLSWRKQDFPTLSVSILSKFIPSDQVTKQELEAMCKESYTVADDKWRHDQRTPLVDLPLPGTTDEKKRMTVLELFHGPTFAFKDVALQFLGNLFPHALKQKGRLENGKGAVILGATSGDTGSAAVAGIQGKENLHAVILYPQNRVSKVQELQMLSYNQRKGVETGVINSVQSCAVPNSDFDACQTEVKTVFADREFCDANNVLAVNSINVGRILAQISYYAWAYFRVTDDQYEALEPKPTSPSQLPKVHFSVPTGNFGDILAGYWMKSFLKLGDAIHLTCASNENDILTRFFATGSYEMKAEVTQTLSPSMDIQISSNFERFLFDVVGRDTARVSQLLADLKANKKFSVTDEELTKSKSLMSAFAASDKECLECISDVMVKSDYLMCPHTACGYIALVKYLDDSSAPAQSEVKHVVLATAHCGKFISTFLPRLEGDEFAELRKGIQKKMPAQLKEFLDNPEPQLAKTVLLDKNGIKEFIEKVVAK